MSVRPWELIQLGLMIVAFTFQLMHHYVVALTVLWLILMGHGLMEMQR